MAKNIEMQYLNGNSYEICYPRSIGSLILLSDSTIASLGLEGNSNIENGLLSIDSKIDTQINNVNQKFSNYSTTTEMQNYIDQMVGAYTNGYTMLFDVDYNQFYTNGPHSQIQNIIQYFSIPIDFLIYKMEVTVSSSFSGHGAGSNFSQDFSKTALLITNGGEAVELASYRNERNVEGMYIWWTWKLNLSLSNNTLNLIATFQNSGQQSSAVQFYINAGKLPLTLKLFA